MGTNKVKELEETEDRGKPTAGKAEEKRQRQTYTEQRKINQYGRVRDRKKLDFFSSHWKKKIK